MNKINLLKKLVSLESIYPNEGKIFYFLFDFFKNGGYQVKKQLIEKNRFNLLVEKGQGEKSILLYSHLDTVDISSGWQTNPLNLIVKNDRAYGLGAWDMKGGMTANILTFLEYQSKNYKLKLVFCIDEENISKGAHQLIKSQFMSDVECVISTEPAFFYGQQGIVTGRVGRAIYNITIKGKSNHFALYNKRIDPIIVSSELILTLQELGVTNKIGKQFFFVRKINSSANGLSTSDLVEIQVDSSILPSTTNILMLKKLKQLCRKISDKYNGYFTIVANLVKRETPFLNPYQIKNNEYLGQMEKSISNITHKKAVPYFRSSLADDNVFGFNGFNVLSIGPLGNNAHSSNEWVSISSLDKLQRILVDFLTGIESKF